jgi:hypothetical protein
MDAIVQRLARMGSTSKQGCTGEITFTVEDGTKRSVSGREPGVGLNSGACKMRRCGAAESRGHFARCVVSVLAGGAAKLCAASWAVG